MIRMCECPGHNLEWHLPRSHFAVCDKCGGCVYVGIKSKQELAEFRQHFEEAHDDDSGKS